MAKSITKQNSIEYELQEDDILYFLHIQKTAGTTLMNILDSYFDLDSIYPEQFWEKLLPNLPLDFSKYKLVRGHFGYGIYRILPKKPVYITMLREPIERTISDYEHIRRDKIKDKEYVPKNETILDALKHFRRKKIFTNAQTGYVALDLDMPSLIANRPSTEKQIMIRRWLGVAGKQTPDDKLLEDAKKHLLECVFVGIVEKFEESLFLLYYTFGWRPLSAAWKLNPSPKRSKSQDLPSETLNEIKKCTKLDSELYAFANQLFDQRYSQMVEDLKEKYYEPSFENLPFRETMYKMLEKHYQHRFNESHIQPHKSIDYDFKQKLSGTGWYWREISESGEAFRWTGPETTSTIDFAVSKKEDLVIQFRVMRAISSDLLDSLTLKVNEHPIEIKILNGKEENIMYEGFIPKSALSNKKDFVRISFEINRTINPHEINPSDPTDRLLGLAIDRIKIIPANEFDKTKD